MRLSPSTVASKPFVDPSMPVGHSYSHRPSSHFCHFDFFETVFLSRMANEKGTFKCADMRIRFFSYIAYNRVGVQ